MYLNIFDILQSVGSVQGGLTQYVWYYICTWCNKCEREDEIQHRGINAAAGWPSCVESHVVKFLQLHQCSQKVNRHAKSSALAQ